MNLLFHRLKYIFLVFLLFPLIFCTCLREQKQVEEPVNSKPADIDPFTMNTKIGRGINLGNALEAPNEGDWGVTLQEFYFDLIKDAGFNSIRVPICWSAHANLNAPYKIDRSFFDRIDWVVNNGLKRNLITIINIHHYEELFKDPDNHRNRFRELWRQIAEHYKDFSADLVFEILNEPHDKLDTSTWNSVLNDAITLIRETNPTRNIIIGAVSWNSIDRLDDMQLPENDRHIIVTYHYYSPFHFTHQGAGWVSGSNAWVGTKWTGTQAEKQAVQNDFDRAQNWGKTNLRPIFMGEFGAYEKAEMNSRVLWTDYVARQAEMRGFSWAYWEFCAGFGVYDKDQSDWRSQLLKALIP